MFLPQFFQKYKYVLFGVLAVAFVVTSYYINSQLLKNDKDLQNQTVTTGQQRAAKKSYQGKVAFIDPSFYPEDKISFKLVDASGDKKILLKADDDKLVVVEGLDVELTGSITKTADRREDVLIVEEITVKN